MKETPLNQIHKQLGARMVEFGGWEMPVEYSGLIEEHLAVRKQAGLFDVSHMGEIEIFGEGARGLVQRVACNDAAKLTPGRSQYSALLNERGGFVDDIMVYCIAPDHFFLCVNASNTQKDLEWILQHPLSGAIVKDVSEDWGLIALQGPRAREIVPSGLKKTFFEKVPIAGIPVLLSATGYTGEEGYEIFCPAGKSHQIWKHLLEKGKSDGLIPCGLGARDTLRLEAAYPLYGHEIDEATNPYEAGLDWIVKLEKGDFIGRAALEKKEIHKQLIGIQMEEPGIPRGGYKIFLSEDASPEGALRGRLHPALPVEGATQAPMIDPAGFVTSGTYSPLLEKGIALAATTLPLTKRELVGRKIFVEIRGRKKQARVVPLPFYVRA